MEKAKHPIFSKTITGLLLSFVLSGFLLIRANKHKQDFDHVEGVIEYIEKTSPLYPNKNPDKYRFLKVDTYNKPFELFVGKASGDFKPKLERIDLLLPGDSVDIYYDENLTTAKEPVNRLVYFIDRNSEAIFVKGSWEQYLAFFLIGLSLVILICVIVLKKKGRIS
ncbi:MAG: hypothetical protein EON98_05890 [Chitinophagaceae bacterium]|nr:MAG: hypothetical protein EON98_05890 [Chitinophagaceae bacterium]